MKIERVVYSRSFAKKLAKFSHKDRQKILRKVTLFWQDPFAPSLKTHKLAGSLAGCWSFSLAANLRIMFRFVTDKTVEFVDIGTHEIYK